MNDYTLFFIFRFCLIVLEVSFFDLAFLFSTKRRKWGIARIAIAILVNLGIVVALSFPMSSLYVKYNFDRTLVSWTGGAVNLFIFFALAVAFYFCFDARIFELVSMISLGYATRQIIFCIYSLLFNFINPDLFLIRYNQQTPLNFFLYFLIYGIYAVAAIILIRRGTKKARFILAKPTAIFLLTAIVVNTVLIAFAETISDEHLLSYSFVLISNIITMSMFIVVNYYTQRQIQLKNDNELMASVMQRQSEQYKFAKANAELMHVKAHDLKHQVEILKAGGEEADKLLDELQSTIYNYESVIVTDNPVINVILSEKWQYCIKHRIKLSCAVDPAAFSNIETVHLYSMLGNVLDNAIEAVMKIKEKDKRIISLNISHERGMSILYIYNYFVGELQVEEGLPLTTKADKEGHGFGMKSIRRVTEHYEGDLTFEVQKDIFYLRISIPD